MNVPMIIGKVQVPRLATVMPIAPARVNST